MFYCFYLVRLVRGRALSVGALRPFVGGADGTVTKAVVETDIGEASGYHVEIRYAYEVDGEKYESDQTDLGVWSTPYLNRKHFQSDWEANEYVSKILAAPNVRVWFNPLNPAEAILDQSFPVAFVSILAMSCVGLLAIGVAFLES